MRRIGLLLLLPLALAAACSTFSESDGAAGDTSDAGDVGDATGAGDAGRDPDPTTDAGPRDGATGDCDVAIPSGTVISSAHFDMGNCEGWIADNGIVQAITTKQRCGAGACRVCVGSAGSVDLQKDVLVVKDGGTFQLDFSVLNETATAQWKAYLNLASPTNVGMGERGNSGAMTTTGWTPGQVAFPNPGTSGRVRMELRGTGDAGQCLIFDEVSLVHY